MTDQRSLLLDNMQSRLEQRGDAEPTKNGLPRSGIRHKLQLSWDQEQKLRQAAHARGIRANFYNEYIEMAVLAFVAYDLDLDLFELKTGKKLPTGSLAADLAIETSRKRRGLWGILGLSDNQRGK